MANEVQVADPIIVKGNGYTYQFSKGLLAHELEARGLGLDEAYSLASTVHNVLIAESINEISEKQLTKYVKKQAVKLYGSQIADYYNLISKWKRSSVPLIILIGGARGSGKSNLGKEIARKMGIPKLVSTSIITQILRRTITKELAPELHSKSYDAHKQLRPSRSLLYDKVLFGYEEHSRYPAEGAEALIKRAINEGISMVIRGEHLVPRFLSEELITHPSILMFTLYIPSESKHRNRYLKNYPDKEQEKRASYFPAIRKMHDYLVHECKNRDLNLIDATDFQKAQDKMMEIIVTHLRRMYPPKKEGGGITFRSFDDAYIDS